MELKKNSWYVWLWEYTYTEDLPNNLCPLFWKLLIAILLFIPNVIFRLPVTFLNLFRYEDEKISRGNNRTGIGIIIEILTALLIFSIVSIYHLILYFMQAYSYNSDLATAGGILSFILIVCIVIIYIDSKKDNIKKKASNNIVVNYTKAWYNNHCPRINWK